MTHIGHFYCESCAKNCSFSTTSKSTLQLILNLLDRFHTELHSR
jgi:hypothetical protein